uniref:Troponin I n=1 Tax=Acartia pacifica TaxID=335913 RepID=R9TIP4_ACAPC|nr:troponin I [Acartia pacifica]
MAKKKGFMTPERKKKLRTLLRKKAAEELKKEQERKAEERLRVIAERCGTKADFESANMDELKKICQQYFDKWYGLEGEMFFLQREVILRDLQINELTISVSDMKGKFIKPTLKKVSKYENKFAKLQEKAAKFAFCQPAQTVQGLSKERRGVASGAINPCLVRRSHPSWLPCRGALLCCLASRQGRRRGGAAPIRTPLKRVRHVFPSQYFFVSFSVFVIA